MPSETRKGTTGHTPIPWRHERGEEFIVVAALRGVLDAAPDARAAAEDVARIVLAATLADGES